MARINVGIQPKYLSDQHLIAESVEITMIVGSLRKDGWKIKGEVPNEFCLGKGHINFFKPKILYLKGRLEEVNNEMRERGFNPSTQIDLLEIKSDNLKMNWSVKFKDTCLIRQRVIERLKNPLRAGGTFHKYYGKPIENMDEFCNQLKGHRLFYV